MLKRVLFKAIRRPCLPPQTLHHCFQPSTLSDKDAVTLTAVCCLHSRSPGALLHAPMAQASTPGAEQERRTQRGKPVLAGSPIAELGAPGAAGLTRPQVVRGVGARDEGPPSPLCPPGVWGPRCQPQGKGKIAKFAAAKSTPLKMAITQLPGEATAPRAG